MALQVYNPALPLGRFVECLWLVEGERPEHPRERLLPTGTAELVFHLREDKIKTYGRKNTKLAETFPGSLVCGPHSGFFVIDTESQDGVMGVHFRPGGSYPFFRLPSSELHNLHVGLDMLWGAKAGELRDRLLHAPTPEKKFKVLEGALIEAGRGSLERHRAVGFALHEFQNKPESPTIARVADCVGLSARRFIDVFEKEVGLTPKLFCRVRRFQKVLRQIQGLAEIDWAEIALSCGYYDQAHFIHDFRSFSGINPSTYCKERTPHLNHVPLWE